MGHIGYLFLRETSRNETLGQLALRTLMHEYGAVDAANHLPHHLSVLIESSSDFPTPCTRDINSGWWKHYDTFSIPTDLLLLLVDIRTDSHGCDLGEHHTWPAEMQELIEPVTQELPLYALLSESHEIMELLCEALHPLARMRFALEDPRDILIVVYC